MTAPAPTRTLPAHLFDDQGRRYWSHSAERRYQRCPRQWSYRYGPHRADLPEDMPRDDDGDILPGLRGKVMHDAVAAALISAGVELAVAHRRTPVAGAPLSRHWNAARRELGLAWDRHGMPHDRHEAADCVEMLRDCLDTVRIPQRRAIVGVESERIVVVDGVAVRYVIDFAYLSTDGRLVIVDWKTGGDDVEAIASNKQLHRYAVWASHDFGIPLEMISIGLYNLRRRQHRIEPVDPARARAIAAEFTATVRAAEDDQNPQPTPSGACSSCFARTLCPAMARHYPTGRPS